MASTLKVKAGDTLYKLAKQHNVSLDALRKANKIEGDKIIAGATLVLPDSYTQAAGKTEPAKDSAHETAVSLREARGKKGKSAATGARLDLDTGTVYATVNGKEIKLGESSAMGMGKLPKVLGDGQYVVWADQKGGYGFESEGQSLHLYDVKTGKSQQVMQEYFMIDDVKLQKLSDGRQALLVGMSDGGLGAPHVAVVDPQRGQVFRSTRSSVLKADGDTLTVGKHDNDENLGKVTSRKSYDLKELLGRPVIQNKPDWGVEDPPVN